ncbi:hypothetical protein [Halobacterium bonnevillei]|uniref:Uncharacterized protein n=1 Tax=Halobacterium bonnevillei TaxID=2692200 RepID=A0A6B0SFG6_9EURY|nr:hypothetical protein [Halobacterium bonnevillei]MXR20328.1 hypothetical protein [Halobacterium bonnevillei]
MIEKLRQFIRDHITKVSFLAWFLLLPATVLLVRKEVGLGTSSADMAIAILELIALTLPALAIMLQAILSYSERPALAATGEGVDLRMYAFLASGLAGTGLFFAASVILQFLKMPSELSTALWLVNFAILGMAILPITIGLYLWSSPHSDLAKFLDVYALHEQMSGIDELDSEEVERLLTGPGIDDSEFAKEVFDFSDGETTDKGTSGKLRTQGSPFYETDE